MSALSLFGTAPSMLPRQQLGFPGSLFEGMERGLRAMRPELAFSPTAEIKHDGEDLEFALELPGIDPKEDVKLRIQGNRLLISGEKRLERSKNGYTEFSYGSFSRSIDLPSGITEEHISASYDAGVLRVRIQGALGDNRGSREIPISLASAESKEKQKVGIGKGESGEAAEHAVDTGISATQN